MKLYHGRTKSYKSRKSSNRAGQPERQAMKKSPWFLQPVAAVQQVERLLKHRGLRQSTIVVERTVALLIAILIMLAC